MDGRPTCGGPNAVREDGLSIKEAEYAQIFSCTECRCDGYTVKYRVVIHSRQLGSVVTQLEPALPLASARGFVLELTCLAKMGFSFKIRNFYFHAPGKANCIIFLDLPLFLSL